MSVSYGVAGASYGIAGASSEVAGASSEVAGASSEVVGASSEVAGASYMFLDWVYSQSCVRVECFLCCIRWVGVWWLV